jgi:hypothetical protein
MRRALLSFAFVLVTAPAAGQVAGGGPRDTDCLSEFVASANRPKARPTKIRCIDGDASCDVDPTPGVCQFPVDVCLNVGDPGLPSCVPRDLEFFTVENFHPDSDPRHDFEFQALEDQVGAFVLPITSDDTDACAGAVTMVLPLEAKVKKHGARWKKSKKILRTTLVGRGGWRDEDKLSMSCVPAKGSEACAGITSTFQQIQEHVLTPSCGRQTCHNAPQLEHTLSLAPGEAWADLVGVLPDDGTARAAGKRRVDPGSPETSYLLDKLRGQITLDQGERMPRLMPKLPSREIRLIEAWIEAGAPETGFVEGSGCGS